MDEMRIQGVDDGAMGGEVPAVEGGMPLTMSVANQDGAELPAEDVKNENGWVKFLRLIVWGLVAVAVPMGLALLSIGRSAGAYADGTYVAKVGWGGWILWVGLLVGVANLGWGVWRWVLRARRQHWKAGKIVGKMIGGGIWRFFAVVPVVGVTLFVLAPLVSAAIGGRVIAGKETDMVDSVMKIEAAYDAGEISVDEYVRYLISAAYATEELPEEYRVDKVVGVPDILGVVEAHLEELELETVERALEVTSMANVDFGLDASGNVLSGGGSLFGGDVYAKTTDVKILNKAKLSSNGRFLVFYTDTGDDRVDDAGAVKVGEMLEGFVDGYRERFGQEYYYEKIKYNMNIDLSGKTREQKMAVVLEEGGIDVKYLDTAMMVYLANPYGEGSTTLATYAGRKFANAYESILTAIFGGIGGDSAGNAKLYASSPMLPLINVLPEHIDTPEFELILAHELGHHYNSEYCYANFGKKCLDRVFVDETLPNYMAINIVEDQPIDLEDNLVSRYHRAYIRYGMCYPINKILPKPDKNSGCAHHITDVSEGYPAVAFLENYAEFVEGGEKRIFDALMEKDAWKFLYEGAGEVAMREVMMRLAQRNLTNDYGAKYSLYADELPHGEEVPCYDLCTSAYATKYATTRYFYFPVEEFAGKTVAMRGADEESLIGVSVLGMRGGKWEVIDSGWPGVRYGIEADGGYELVGFAATNYAMSGEGRYVVEIVDAEMEDIVEDMEGVMSEDVGWLGVNGSCVWMEMNGFFDTMAQMSGLIDVLGPAKAGVDGTQWQQYVGVARGGMGFSKMTICDAKLRVGTSFAEAKARVKRMAGWSMEVWGDEDVSVMVSYDVLRQSARGWVVGKDGGGAWLYSLRLE